MEKTEVNTAIEQIDESVNQMMDENENLLTMVLPTLVILILLKKMLNYGNKNEKVLEEDNCKISIKENKNSLLQKPCKLYEAIYEAAYSSLSEIDISKKEDFPIVINKHCSHIPGHKHSHMQSFFSLYNNLGLNYVKHFIHCSIIRFTPISTITSRKELEYYKKRVISEENKNESLQKQYSFLDLKYKSLLNQLNYEKNAREIYEKCFRESNKKLIDELSELVEKCRDLEDDNNSLRRKLENNYSTIDYNSDDDDDGSQSKPTNLNFKRQEEERQKEEEAKKLLSDLDQRGMDDFVSKYQDGKCNFKESVSSILYQLFTSELDAVQVSIELDQFVKKCQSNQMDKKCDAKKEVLNAIIEVICKLVEKKNQKKIKFCALEIIPKYISLFQEYLGNNKKDKINFLTLIFNNCKIFNTVRSVFVNIVYKFYKLNIIDEDTILRWYDSHGKDIQDIINDNDAFAKFLETLNLEYLKKNMILKKEFDIYEDNNDSGFYSGDDEMNEYLTSNGQFLESSNLESSDFEEESSYDSWEIIDNRNIPCNCSSCNGKENGVCNTSLLKEKSHVRFEEPEILSDKLLLENSDQNVTLKDNNECLDHECYHGRCLLDIVEDYEENENNSFIIQDIKGEHIFSNNKNLLEDCCSNHDCGQSDSSSITMNSMESQDYQVESEDEINEHGNYCANCIANDSKLDDSTAVFEDSCGNYYQEDDSEEIESSFTHHNDEIIEKVEEEFEEYCIINETNAIDCNCESEEEYEEYEEEEENRVDIEIYYEKNNTFEDYECEGNDIEICFEQSDEEDSELEICFENENEATEDEDSDFEVYFENDNVEDDETSEEEEEDDSEEEDDENESEEEDDDEDEDSDDDDDDEDEDEEDEEEEDNEIVKNEDVVYSYEGNKNGKEVYALVVDHDHLSNDSNTERMISTNTYSKPDEMECESVSDNDIEIVFEGHSDVETEIYSDESEDEERTYDSESDDGSDTEYDDEKIEKIASLRSKLSTEDFIKHDEECNRQLCDIQSSSKDLKTYTHLTDSAVVLDDDNIDEEDDDDEENSFHKRNYSNDINSDINEIIYDSEIDVVLCSSDCTIEISDDQSEINNYSKNNTVERKKQIEEEEENNENVYPDLEKIKEDGHRKYMNKNVRKKVYCNKDTNFQELINFCKLKPEIKNDIEDYFINKYGNLYLNDNSVNSKSGIKYWQPSSIKKAITRNRKGIKKSSKKHCIKNENFLNRSSLRNVKIKI